MTSVQLLATEELVERKPKILFYDLETFPNEGLFWDLKVDGYLSHESITKERNIICGSWKWQGEKEVNSICVTPTHPRNDRKVVEKLHSVIKQADAIVHHHGDSFDLPWLKARCVYWGLEPLPPVIKIDTRKIARANFYFNSNKLDYLARYLGLGEKIRTDYNLWKDCLKGDEKALEKMVRYNKRDVVLLEYVFDILLPWIPAKLNQVLFAEREVCQHCGSNKIQYRGFHYTRSNKFRRYQCKDCGSWSRSTAPYKEK